MIDSQIFKKEIEKEFHQLLNWWIGNMVDEESGGFYGRIDGHNQLHPKADKAIILNSRILWTFSAAANFSPTESYKATAKRAYDYLIQHFWDTEAGGVYWMLDYQGKAIQTKKQIYAQAFAIYAFSEYYQLTREEEALEKAIFLFELIEKYSFDQKENGYFEAYSQNWELLEDLRLSEKDANEAKTMNTHLHILEAYTNLYKVHKAPNLQRQLTNLIQLFSDKFITLPNPHLHLFFDEHWNLKSHEISFGHDIEASWLLVEAAEVLGDVNLLDKTKALALKIAEATLKEGIANDGSLLNEAAPNGITDDDRHWWPQAEAIVGFLNAYQISNDNIYLDTSFNLWNFIKEYMLDHDNDEWHWMVNNKGLPNYQEDKAGPWKAPYHNGRMCLEVLKGGS